MGFSTCRHEVGDTDYSSPTFDGCKRECKDMSALGDTGMNKFLDRSSILLTSTKIGHATIVAFSIFLILENRTRESLNVKKVAGGKFFSSER